MSHTYLVVARGQSEDTLARIDTCLRSRSKLRWHPAPHVWIVGGRSANGWSGEFKRAAPAISKAGGGGDLIIGGLTRSEWSAVTFDDAVRSNVDSWSSNENAMVLCVIAVGLEDGKIAGVRNNLRDWSDGWVGNSNGTAEASILTMSSKYGYDLGPWQDALKKNWSLDKNKGAFGLFLLGLNGMRGAWASFGSDEYRTKYTDWLTRNL